MGRDDSTETKPRARPRKQYISTKEVCTAPVIELTSSSDDESPPPPQKTKPKPSRPSQARNMAPMTRTATPVMRTVAPVTRTATPVRRPPSYPPTKPPILGKRTSQSPAKSAVSRFSNLRDLKTQKLSDREKLLSILENDGDIGELPVKKVEKYETLGNIKGESVKDNLLESIEDELRHIHEPVDKISPDRKTPASVLEQTAFKKVTGASKDVKRTHVIGKTITKNHLPYPVRGVRETFEEAFASSIQEDLRKNENSTSASAVRKDARRFMEKVDSRFRDKTAEKPTEKTRVLSPSEIQLPPEVLEAIKKRTNLGRIEKIVEKTDGNHKSKYIVIFNKGSAKKRSSGERDIESLLNSIPSKQSPTKITKFSDRTEPEPKRGIVKVSNTIVAKSPHKPVSSPAATVVPSKRGVFEKSLPSLDLKRDYNALIEKRIKTPIVRKFDERKSASLLLSPDQRRAQIVKLSDKKETQRVREEPVRFTESPLSHEPWDPDGNDGFEKYFKVIDRLVEHHDSVDESDSDSNEPVMFSHFKSLDSDRVMTISKNQRPEDKISVNNIADTIRQEFPKWKVEQVDGSDTICLVQMAMGVRARTSMKKQIKIDSDYNVTVIVDHMNIPEYEGMYDSFDNIKQLIFEIDQL
ncbi:Hypothetical protein NTJ_04830 [Nesidiocoris tenuis]|uniref:Uncharacterized protein n=1 Tax=Nesidiocoris tenuis TaxID=355587 RepID=A0ABN7AIE1_9HEMI|nr:Hypothetical protein NTJ_04830 [Nesidiocoris tenuis]